MLVWWAQVGVAVIAVAADAFAILLGTSFALERLVPLASAAVH